MATGDAYIYAVIFDDADLVEYVRKEFAEYQRIWDSFHEVDDGTVEYSIRVVETHKTARIHTQNAFDAIQKNTKYLTQCANDSFGEYDEIDNSYGKLWRVSEFVARFPRVWGDYTPYMDDYMVVAPVHEDCDDDFRDKFNIVVKRDRDTNKDIVYHKFTDMGALLGAKVEKVENNPNEYGSLRYILFVLPDGVMVEYNFCDGFLLCPGKVSP
jgi:hypothetical protein